MLIFFYLKKGLIFKSTTNNQLCGSDQAPTNENVYSVSINEQHVILAPDREDLALLRLDTPAKFRHDIFPICMSDSPCIKSEGCEGPIHVISKTEGPCIDQEGCEDRVLTATSTGDPCTNPEECEHLIQATTEGLCTKPEGCEDRTQATTTTSK